MDHRWSVAGTGARDRRPGSDSWHWRRCLDRPRDCASWLYCAPPAVHGRIARRGTLVITRLSEPERVGRAPLPPQSRIVLPFENPPDVLRAVGRLAHEVPAGIEERLGRLHLGGGLACAAGHSSVWPEVWVSQKQAVTSTPPAAGPHAARRHTVSRCPLTATGAVALGHRTTDSLPTSPPT